MNLPQDLDELITTGSLVARHVITPTQCDALAALYARPEHFRSRVIMARHGFGQGEYQYFSDPLPDLVQQLRTALYPLLVPIANRWGGEFVMTEQRPRMQSRPEVLPLEQGDAAIFAVHHRPVQGSKGIYRVNMRHGVSRLRSGHRHTLGLIFHDAL